MERGEEAESETRKMPTTNHSLITKFDSSLTVAQKTKKRDVRMSAAKSLHLFKFTLKLTLDSSNSWFTLTEIIVRHN